MTMENSDITIKMETRRIFGRQTLMTMCGIAAFAGFLGLCADFTPDAEPSMTAFLWLKALSAIVLLLGVAGIKRLDNKTHI